MPEFVKRYKRYAQILSVFAKHDFGFLVDSLGLGKLFQSKELPKSEDKKETEEEVSSAALVKTNASDTELAQKAEETEKGDALTIAERLRMAFEELGPTFVKMGQLLSTRPDLIPRAYIVEFRKLQDHVTGISFSQVKEVIESELGGTIEDTFSSFEEEALAAASIAQVHRCVLKDGQQAVVKVQRPGIEETIRLDLTILYAMARLAQHSSMAESIDMVRIVQEFERSILRELDFTSEGRLTEEFAQNFADDPEVHIAEIYWDYSSRRVLAMEFLDGINVSDVEALKEKGVDGRKLAKKICMVTLKQIFAQGLFHADPHPGNLMVLEGEVLGILDFGMIGRFDRYTLSMLRDLMIDVVRQDHVSMASHLLDHDIVGFDVDMRSLRGDIRSLFRNVASMPMAQASEALQKFIVEHKLQFPADLFFLDKTFGTLDGTIRLLAPTLNLGSIAEEFTSGAGVGIKDLEPMVKDLAVRVLQDAEALVEMPVLTRRIMKRIDAGFLGVQAELHISKSTYAVLNRLGLKFFLFITAITCFIFSWITRDVGAVGIPGGMHLHTSLLTSGAILLVITFWSMWKAGKET